MDELKMANKATERMKRYEAKYVRRFGFKLNYRTDTEILVRLEQEENLSGFIKKCIRAQIEREKEGNRNV